MNNSLMGISALDPTVAATDKFIKEKNIPPDQIEDFLLSMGADPRLAALVFKNRRLQQAAQNQQKGEAPATTVDQDVSNQYAQLKQQERAKRGISAIPAPNLARALMQGGITGEPVKTMAGGGPVAFVSGGSIPYSTSTVTDEMFDWDTWNNAYKEAQRTGNTAEMSRLKALAEKYLPTFTRYAEKAVPVVSKYGTKLVKGAPFVGGLAGLYGASESDPESLQATSRLAQLGMDVDPSSKTKTGLAAITGTLESMLPTGLFYDTPLDRAQALTDEKVKRIQQAPGVQTNLSPDEVAIGQEYMRIVREKGANSQEAKDYEAKYRQIMGRSSVEDEDELARVMAQSAAGGAGTKPGAPRLPGVPIAAKETKALTELRGRLAGMEDVSKPEAREAAIDREMASRMKRYTDMGILKPFDDAKANVQGRLKELEGIKDKNFYKAMAMMGFTMASTRGSFFQALAAGGAAGLSAYETFEEKRQATLDKLQDRITSIDMNIANIKERAGAGAEARVDKLESDRKNLENQITTLQSAQETLAQTQSFQLALSDREIAAQAARDQTRFGGLEKVIEQDIVRYRAIADDPKQKANVREAARKKIEQLYREREKATQGGSGSFQAAQLKALSSGIPGYPYATIDSEKGGDDPYGVNALVAQYGQ